MPLIEDLRARESQAAVDGPDPAAAAVPGVAVSRRAPDTLDPRQAATMVAPAASSLSPSAVDLDVSTMRVAPQRPPPVDQSTMRVASDASPEFSTMVVAAAPAGMGVRASSSGATARLAGNALGSSGVGSSVDRRSSSQEAGPAAPPTTEFVTMRRRNVSRGEGSGTLVRDGKIVKKQGTLRSAMMGTMRRGAFEGKEADHVSASPGGISGALDDEATVPSFKPQVGIRLLVWYCLSLLAGCVD
jgi:hypothetical protein